MHSASAVRREMQDRTGQATVQRRELAKAQGGTTRTVRLEEQQ